MPTVFSSRYILISLLLAILSGAACGSSPPASAPAVAPSGDAAFDEVAHLYLEEKIRMNQEGQEISEASGTAGHP